VASRDFVGPSVVVLVADGARYDVLESAIRAGELPALARLRTEGGMHEVTSVFPSVTGPAYAPFIMGRFPGHVGLPGIRWYDRDRTRARWPAYSRSYVGYDIASTDGDIPAGSPTIFELVPRHLAALSVIERGLQRRDKIVRGPWFVWRAAVTHFRGDVTGWLDMDRGRGMEFAARIRRDRPDFAFCAMTGPDKTSHANGHAAATVRQSLKSVDDTVARIRTDAEADGRWDAMHLWVVSDHGHSPVHTHEDLAGLLRQHGVRTRAHPFTIGFGHRAAVMVSGNAMAHVHVGIESKVRPWWPAARAEWGWLADLLLYRPATDLMVLPASPTSCEVHARARGHAVLSWHDGAYSYECRSGDPLAIGTRRGLDAEASYDLMRDSDYPDGLVQLASLVGCSRSGDIILSAARGYDFRAKYEPIPHVSAHGALHREHMMAPLIVNKPVARPPRRTADVFATACEVLGVRVGGPQDGTSWLAT